MSSSLPLRRLVGRLFAVLGVVGLAAALSAPGVARAADERPKEMPYESTGPIPLLDPSYRMESHKVVLITDHALNPRLVKLDAGQLVAWISYSGWPSTVVFERETAKNMICHSLVNFQIKDDEIRSQPIHAGEFASFCQLKPGRYLYRVIRTDNPTMGTAPSKTLNGEIIVAEEKKG
ncbi:MAG: hypothetical protein JRG85_10025 [Deltaproteobacteria bacterium]|nr:hypothetical protein [Deltaproteobacteria bacterium]